MVKRFISIISKLDNGVIFRKKQFQFQFQFPLFLAFVLALAFIILSWLVFNNFLVDFDANVEASISTWSFKGLHTYFDFVTDSKTIVATTLIAVIILYLKKQARLAVFLILATAGGWAMSLGFKFLFQRVRPGVEPDDNIFSYPSGHATISICLYGALIFIANRFITNPWVKLLLNTSLALFILSIGLSRVYFGFHYPTDVLAGWFMGGSYLLFLIAGYNLVTASLDYYEKP